jgi:cytosine/adenosine deaminase-related metal-dependent hydrolase
LKEAIKNSKIKAIILARPRNMKYDEEEMEKLLDISHGIGISSIADWDFEELEMITRHVKERKKIFAMHASEDKREDIGRILDLAPHFLVHLCKATEEDINEVANKKIGVVICPRANKFFGLEPPITLLLEKNASVMLGTDNAMIVKPDIIKEMNFLIKNYDVEREIAVKMISNTPLKIFGEILKNHVHS